MKYSNLDDYLRETKGAELKVGLCKLYFDDGEWVVLQAKSRTSHYYVIDRFLDAVPSALEEALRYLDKLQAE